MTQLTEPTIHCERPRCPYEACDPTMDRTAVAEGWDFEYGTTRREFTVVRCNRCGIIHLSSIPDEASLPVIYPSTYYSYAESASENPLVKCVRDFLERGKIRAFDRLVPDRPASVLDIGCGDGRLLDIFRRQAGNQWTLCGIEIGQRAADAAREKGYEVRTGTFEQGEISSWTDTFDLILLHQVLEHLHSPKEGIAKVRRMLKPGGILSIETPDTNAWDVNVFGKRYWGGYHIPRHFYLFTKTALRRLLEEQGFEIISSRSLLSPMFWVHSVHNYLTERPSLAWLGRWATAGNIPLLTLATVLDWLQIHTAGTSSNQQVLARRRH